MDYPGKVIRKTQVTPTQTSASGVWTVDDASAAVKTNTWPVAGVPNPISKSLRFNSADTAYLNRTFGTPTSGTTWTLSMWVKLSEIPPNMCLFMAGTGASNTFMRCTFSQTSATSSELNWRQVTPAGGLDAEKGTSQVFRDPSSWYHFVFVWNTTVATASDRQQIYLNGSRITAFGSNTEPSQNLVAYFNTSGYVHYLGALNLSGLGSYFDGYLTEINFIDGQALTPSSFGITDPQTGVWVPIKYTGTYGTNGFYLNFKDASSTSALGYDYSGNGNNWTTNNFSVTAGSGNDSLTDVPTPWIAYNTGGDVGGVFRGNYATLNPLDSSSNLTISNGNLQIVSASSSDQWCSRGPAISIPVYIEGTIINTPSSLASVGIYDQTQNLGTWTGSGNNVLGENSDAYGLLFTSGNKKNNGSSVAYGSSFAADDIWMMAFDPSAGKIWWGKNGTWFASGNPASGTNAAYTGITGNKSFGITMYPSGAGTHVNFGQRPFAYTPPAGYLSLCTTNLPTPTIGATSSTQAGKYMNVVLYTGTGSSLSVTGAGFQPDFVWIKGRSGATDHGLYDAVRGVQNQLESNTTTAETAETTGLTAFGSDGFTVGALAQLNTNTATYVGWNWKANGSGSSNTDGTITSTVSANTTAGFSIVTYTGTGSNATVGHGLGVAPSMVIVKARGTPNGIARSWFVYHISLGGTKFIYLDLTDAAVTGSTVWNDTNPSSTVFTLGNENSVNMSSNNYVAYCFAAVAGYSAFGSYTGNGSTDGPFVYTGFRPRYVFYKRTDSTGPWVEYDTARNTYNVANTRLELNSSAAEVAASDSRSMDILSNGFKLRGASVDTNASGGTYIYAAFAESPFKYANAR